MKLREIYKSGKTVISFEIFPPDNAEAVEKLFTEAGVLKNLNPAFISLTHSASGKNKENARKIFLELKNDFNFQIMPHFTCICSTKENIDESLDFFKTNGTENILALRGDIPEDKSIICKNFCNAAELVEYLNAKTDFSIAVAGYPEGHIESPSIKADIENLKKKIDSGADVIFTQMFFENEKFFEFLDRIEKAGIQKPVAAGIMPVISLNQLNKMTRLAKVTIPEKFKEKIISRQDDKNYIRELGIEFASKQCLELLEHNADGLHFFTLNRSYSAKRILENIYGGSYGKS